MRCPHCAAETPEGSRFCGICGRKIEGAGDVRAGAAPAMPHRDMAAPGPAAPGPSHGPAPAGAQAVGSMSLFELPVKRGARLARVLAILALDAVLAGAGVAMIVSYVSARDRAHATPARAVDGGMAEVHVLTPSRPAAPEPAAGYEASAAAAAEREPAGEPSEQDIEGLTRQVAQLVERNTRQLQRCYQQAARSSLPGAPLEGRVDIHLEITPAGHASNVYSVTNTSNSEPLARCVAGLFESWTYPESPGTRPLELVWPLRFKAPKK